MALINIGSTKQLFVDNFLIESLSHARQVLNPAEKVENNPILRPERPWEGNHVGPSYVIFDQKDKIFKMWYGAVTYQARQRSGVFVQEAEGPSRICFAISDDGIQWERPVLGLVEFQGSTENNILPDDSYKPYFLQDLHEEDPAKRYKGFTRTGSPDSPGMQFDLYYSADGFNWKPYVGNPVIDTAPRVGRWGPTNFMGWDPIRHVYAVHMENCHHMHCPLGKRVIGRAESPDMIRWTEAETILVPDEKDFPDTEFYELGVTVYEGIFVGLLWIFRTSNGTITPEIIFSRDGIHYERNYREPFIPHGAKGEFDAGTIFTRPPIVYGSQILTYYQAVNWRTPEEMVALGDKVSGAIGLAVTPLDGFVSVDGSKGMPVDVIPNNPDVADFSRLVTRSFSFSGRRHDQTGLYLNLAAAPRYWGTGPCEVRVEILDPNHTPVPGFGFQDADPIHRSGQSQPVSWRGQQDLRTLAGKPIKLKIYFKNAKLFAFQFR